jgi:hypothetical protein
LVNDFNQHSYGAVHLVTCHVQPPIWSWWTFFLNLVIWASDGSMASNRLTCSFPHVQQYF